MKSINSFLRLGWLVSMLIIGPASPFALAKKVPISLAREVATGFIAQHFTTDSLTPFAPQSLELRYARESPSPVVNGNLPPDVMYYVFEFESNPGYILVAGDDRSVPILGYSTQSGFDPDALHPEIRKWLENYTAQIRYILQEDGTSNPEVESQWNALISGRELKSVSSFQSAGPLCPTRWNQSPYFNQYCPYDNRYSERTVTGCVATAMAQIMKFWNYPAQGAGFHSYNHEDFGTLSANFGGVEYSWSNMPNQVSSTNEAVATLMYHCGISVDMHYGVGSVGGSGAYVITAASPVEHCSEYALENYFGYDHGLQGLKRSSYTDENWMNLLRTELNAGRPVLYAGFGSGGGHCFVCDGFNGNYFHMNWGWGGAYDGFFLIGALDPSGVGTGGGNGGFNSNQQAVIGIKPPTNQTTPTDMALYDHITSNPSEVIYGNSFTVHTDLANFGTTTFNGDICVALFDQDINFVDFVEVLTGYTLEGGFHYTGGLDFSYAGSFTLLPGTYSMAAFYRPVNQNWILLDDNGDYHNLATLTVKHENDLEMYGPITLSTQGDIVQGVAFSVNLDITNYGAATFNGTLDVSLYDLEGDFVEEIGSIDNVSLQYNYHFTNGITFYSSGVSVEPGTYLLALLYQPNGADWELAGSTSYTNPIKVIVKVAPLISDPYENNNTKETAYRYNPVYVNNTAFFQTPGSTIHTGQDYDYYGISLDAGYTYTITGRLHDSYSSGNGEVYTNDVMASMMVGDFESDVYDDILPTFTVTAYGSGIAYYLVSPYFTGDKGSYLLDLKITRVYGTGIETIPVSEELKIWPNPVTSKLNLEGLMEPISRIRIISITGQVFRYIHLPDEMGITHSIDVTELKTGTYFVEVTTARGRYQQRFIKSE